MLQNTCKKYELNLNLTSSYKRQRNGSALSLHKLRAFGYAFQGRVTVPSITCASNFIYKKILLLQSWVYINICGSRCEEGSLAHLHFHIVFIPLSKSYLFSSLFYGLASIVYLVHAITLEKKDVLAILRWSYYCSCNGNTKSEFDNFTCKWWL